MLLLFHLPHVPVSPSEVSYYYYSLSELENYSDKDRFVFNPFSILDRFYPILCITWHSNYSQNYMIMG